VLFRSLASFALKSMLVVRLHIQLLQLTAIPLSIKLSAESHIRSEFNSTHISRYFAYYCSLSPEPVIVLMKFVPSNQCLLDPKPGPEMGRLSVGYCYGLTVRVCLRICQNVNSRSAIRVSLPCKVPNTSPNSDFDSRDFSLLLPL
jgi:hypothetical protein